MFYMFFSLERTKQPGLPLQLEGEPGLCPCKDKKIKLPAGLETSLLYGLFMRYFQFWIFKRGRQGAKL